MFMLIFCLPLNFTYGVRNCGQQNLNLSIFRLGGWTCERWEECGDWGGWDTVSMVGVGLAWVSAIPYICSY